jgi:predicted esterase
MAKNDLPSMINYILKLTNQEKLFYIGHSQGTMIGFSQFSQNTVLASKVKLFIALGPVATVGSIESPVRYFAGPTPATDVFILYLFKVIN